MLLTTFLKSIILLLMVALSVGFYTLLERKVLAYIQMRKGPNKPGIMGLPQPLADALKLFTKETIFLASTSKTAFFAAPLLAMMIMFSSWIVYLSAYGIVIFKLGILFFLAVTSLNVYTLFLSGWASNSKYAMIGAMRGIAQTISYEVSMALIIITTLLFSKTFNLALMSKTQTIWLLFIIPPVFLMWMITCFAETNRAPFDLAEGESELVSGFNIEYGGGAFTFLFIAEYGSILLLSMITTALFMAGMNTGTGTIKMMLIAYTFLWVRGSFPRLRYDTLMTLTWKTFLSIILSFIFLFIMTNSG